MDSSNPTIDVRQGEEIDPEQLDEGTQKSSAGSARRARA